MAFEEISPSTPAISHVTCDRCGVKEVTTSHDHPEGWMYTVRYGDKMKDCRTFRHIVGQYDLCPKCSQKVVALLPYAVRENRR